MPLPVVSVNMCTYNASRYVGATLRSVLAQTLQDFQIVIVDDGSTDGTADLIACEFRDSRITLIREQHVTLRVARNLALAHSCGEFIAFLDSDDLWAPTKLERQVAIARGRPDVGLIFSDCELIDQQGRRLGRRFSDQFAYGAVDFGAGRVHVELLDRGNFIASPTPLVPAALIRSIGGFNHTYRHVNDYDLWLRLARRAPFVYCDERLASYRVHEGQFTQRRMEVTLPEQRALLHPIMRSASYPPRVRLAIGDNLLGQHRLAWTAFVAGRHYAWAARAALGMLRYPDRLCDYVRDRARRSAWSLPLEAGIRTAHAVRGAGAALRDSLARIRARVVNDCRRVIARARRVPKRLGRILRREEPLLRPPKTEPPQADTAAAPAHVWIDGTCLGREQTGYFNLLTELVRGVVATASVVHVSADGAGRAALRARLGAAADGVIYHAPGWRTVHWSQVHQLLLAWPAHLLLLFGVVTASLVSLVVDPRWLFAILPLLAVDGAVLGDEMASMLRGTFGRRRDSYVARLVRFLWRRWPAPRRRAPVPNAVEVLFWRGRFRWCDSRRIAVVQDMTTRIHPEMHTPGNVSEFEEFLGYVQRHAHEILTVSQHSRRDIIDRIAVCPESVSVIPMPVHPQYIQPRLSRGYVSAYGISSPYVLCVGTIEPRKNLRRLVNAFELVCREDALQDHELVLVGPQGWDSGFYEFLHASNAAKRVRRLGFVALDHLPSLYHHATAVVCASVYEGFGIPVLEALCSSAVVMASNVSALPEVLGDGIQFDPYDSASIAAALLRAASMTEDERLAHRARGRQRADAHLQRVARDGPLPGLLTSAAAKLCENHVRPPVR